MHHPTKAAAILVTLAAPSLLPAQSLVHYLYPDHENPQNCTQFATRSELGLEGGEILQEGLGYHTKGVGNNNFVTDVGNLRTIQVRLQDRIPATRDVFRLKLRRANASGTAPDPTAAGVVWESQWYPMPSNQTVFDFAPALGGTIQYDTCVRHYYGVELQAAPNYPNDGIAVWYADDTQGTLGDNGRAGAPGTTWVVKLGVAVKTAERGALRLAVHTTEAPVLNVGARNPNNTRQTPTGTANFGRGGLFPDIKNDGIQRYDDFVVEVRAFAGSIAVVALDVTEATPFAVPGFTGKFYLPPATAVWLPPMPVGPQPLRVHLPLGPPASPLRSYYRLTNLRAQAVVVPPPPRPFQFSNMALWQSAVQP
jgi:hypothetical protein